MTLLQFAIVLSHKVTEDDQRLKHVGRQLDHIKENAAAILAEWHVVLAEDACDFYEFGPAHCLNILAKGLAALVFVGIHLKRVRGS